MTEPLMESPTQLRQQRRWKGRFIRFGLVLLAAGLVVGWIARKRSRDDSDSRIVVAGDARSEARAVARARSRGIEIAGVRRGVEETPLGAGDMRIYNRDSTVDLVLRGPEVLAGLSPKTVERVRAEMAKSSDKDSSGLGGLIASTVKQTVASTIGTHVAYPVSNIEAMRFENGQLIIEHTNGKTTRLFGDTKVNNREQGKTFDAADAQRFIDAVMARKKELGR